jgi:hypothetical protein
MVFCFCGVYFIINELVYFVDLNIVTLNGRSVVMTFLFDWFDCVAIATQQPDVSAYTKCNVQLIKVAPDDGLI